jgi:hypothetical protein
MPFPDCRVTLIRTDEKRKKEKKTNGFHPYWSEMGQ